MHTLWNTVSRILHRVLRNLHFLWTEATFEKSYKEPENYKQAVQSQWCRRTQWCRVHLERLIVVRLVKKFSAFYGSRRFVIMFTRVLHLSPSWASSVQFILLHAFCRCILVISHLPVGLLNYLFPTGFSTKILYAPFLSHIRATCPAYLTVRDFITCIFDDSFICYSSTTLFFVTYRVLFTTCVPCVSL